MATGNTFGSKTFSFGHAKKVWREIRHRFPGGGTISNLSDWENEDVIPAGTPAYIDMATSTVKALKVLTAGSGNDKTAVPMNGYTQEDIVIKGATVASATVVYDGELYAYMYADEDIAVLEKQIPGVKFVQ